MSRLEYFARSQYGRRTLRIADDATAKHVSRLTRRQTVTIEEIQILAHLMHARPHQVLDPAELTTS